MENNNRIEPSAESSASGGYNSGYSDGFEEGYLRGRSGRRPDGSGQDSAGGYSDGYNAGYEAGYRRSMSGSSRRDGYSGGSHHSSRHSSRSGRGYDEDDSYYDGSRHHSSHHHSSHSSRSGYDEDDSYDGSHHSSRHHSSHHHSSHSSSSGRSTPGRLASHHRSRHHHHHHHHHSSSEPQENLPTTYEALPIDVSRIGMKSEIEAVEIPIDLGQMQEALSGEYREAGAEDLYYADVEAARRDGRYQDDYPDDYPDDIDGDYNYRRGTGYEDGGPERPAPNRTPGPLAATIVAATAINPPKTHDASAIESSGSRRRRRNLKKRQTIVGILIRILIVLILLIAAGIGGLVYLRARGQKAMTHDEEDITLEINRENTPEEVEEIEDEGKTIVYKGEKYRWNNKISTVLFLGSDRTLDDQASRESTIGINGQADTILLGVIDNKNKKISFINVNRDTMTNVAQYTPDGDYAGDKQMQICLAYSYGKDNVESCEMMASTVSNLLYGIPVDSYARISYDAVPMLNDSVGGVTVKVLEDMTSVEPTFVKGEEVTLVGNQALRYIRWRNTSVTETNELRMARQKQYFYAFANKTIEATRADLTLPLGLYNNAKPYMTTDITPSRVTYLTSKVLEYGVKDGAINTVKGGSVDGPTGLVEFHTDEAKLFELVLDIFYNKVD